MFSEVTMGTIQFLIKFMDGQNYLLFYYYYCLWRRTKPYAIQSLLSLYRATLKIGSFRHMKYFELDLPYLFKMFCKRISTVAVGLILNLQKLVCFASMYENDALQTVPDSEITAILGCLKPLFPKSIHAYYFIDNLVKWKKKVPEMDIAILTPKGGYKTGAVFFYFIAYNHLVFSAYIWCKEGEELLRNSLLETKRFPWAEFMYVLVTCLTEEVYTVLEPAIGKILSTRSSLSIGHDTVYWLPAEEVIKFDVKVPDGMRLDELKEEHAERINSVWPHRTEGSVDMMKLMMWVNFGRGLFKSNGELAAWAFYWFFGALGVVQTAESERRKGYGKVVVQAVCKEMGLRGLDVHLNIVEGNTVSEAFFNSLGFKRAFNSVWVFSFPANDQKT